MVGLHCLQCFGYDDDRTILPVFDPVARHFSGDIGMDATTTQTELLEGLRAGADNTAWSVFCLRYRPMIVAFARRLGLSEQDAEDAAQEALLAFATAYRRGDYDRQKGRLRTWFLTIAMNKVRDIRRRRGKEIAPAGGGQAAGALNVTPEMHGISRVWEEEWQQAVIRSCIEAVREQVSQTTMQAFELFVIKEWPAQKVATQIGISPNAVYLAKRNVLSRMRETRKLLQEIW
jgi:RNA polymerase sigma-70 factor (ECF subfamily)